MYYLCMVNKNYVNNKKNNNWNEVNKLTRKVTVNDFVTAVEVIKKVKIVAEQMIHHPNIYLHDYNQLDFEVYTHTENKLTAKDYELVQKIDEILEELNPA